MANFPRERIGRARAAARFYRELGWNPIPSRGDRKAPTIPYSHLWETPIFADVLEDWGGPNVQVMTGACWGLAVVDLDGPEAIARWPELGEHPPTWTSARDPARSRHVWFSLPDWLPSLRSKGHLWGIPDGEPADLVKTGEPAVHLHERGRPAWKPHAAIELLADRKLVLAPPSWHPETGQPYRWLPDLGPAEIGRPAPAPEWLLRLPDLDVPPPRPAPARSARRPSAARPGASYDWRDVLAAVPDWTTPAAGWGLRIDGRRAGRDAVAVHAIGRPDNRPSGLLNVKTGRYWDPWIAGGRGIDPFRLAIELGAYATFSDAVNDLGARYHARPATN